jgi:hypothetical protein
MASSVPTLPPRAQAPRDELGARIGQLERDFRLLSVDELCRRADLVRDLARANGLERLAWLAGGLGDALSRRGRDAEIQPLLAGMREQLGAAPCDEASARAFPASVSASAAH